MHVSTLLRRLFLYSVLCFLTGCSTVREEPKLILRANQVQVKDGESIYTIAARHGLTPRQLMQVNQLTTTHVNVGEILLIPPKEMFQKQRENTYIPPSTFDLKTDVSSEISGAKMIAIPEAATAPQPLIEKRTSDFIWPLSGPVLQAFGKAPGALSLGITIGGGLGDDVCAVKDGIVAYVGDDLPDYGLLVLVRHVCGTVSVYGNLSEILIEKDAEVRQGQVIGKVGNSGMKKEGPRLYFELRRPKDRDDKKPKAVNPLPYLSQ